MSKTLTVQAGAKINWSLNITGLRNDGYHLLDMVMQSIDLCDTLVLRATDEAGVTLRMSGASGDVPATADNLAVRGALAALREAGINGGVDITLTKRIPSCAGLGGGSADAAAAIMGTLKLYGAQLDRETLIRIAVGCGADVPFLLRGGLARSKGIGEILTPCTAKSYPLLIVKGDDGVSTKEIFRAYDAAPCTALADNDALISALEGGRLAEIKNLSVNHLYAPAAAACPDIDRNLALLCSTECIFAAMSGSGSAVFAVYEDHGKAEKAYGQLVGKAPTLVLTRTTENSLRFE